MLTGREPSPLARPALLHRCRARRLTLTEALTPLSDSANPAPDEISDEAREALEEPALASLILPITLINIWNRLNATSRQVAGT